MLKVNRKKYKILAAVGMGTCLIAGGTSAAYLKDAVGEVQNVITVGNLLFNGRLDDSSNYGAVSVDLAAPGTYILSTIPGDSYAYMSGTSMAAPMVTGAAALIYSARTDLSLQDIKTAILSTVHKLAPLKGKTATGGMLDVSAAIKWTKN